MTEDVAQSPVGVLPVLLVLASTYPRWAGDPEPGFVHELSKRLTDRFRVIVLGPHAAGAKTCEILDGVEVRRYRYAPERMETLVNDGGIVSNLRRARWKWLLVPGFVMAQLWTTWRLVSRERPGVVHAHWLLPQGLILALLGLVDRRMPPWLVTSHGADLYSLRATPLVALKRFVARRATMATVVSSAMLKEVRKLGIDASKICVQSMGVDLSCRFTPGDRAKRSSDELLFVGRMVEKKGLRHLIDAMPLILSACPAARLAVVGFGPEEVSRRVQVVRLGLSGNVKFLGAVPQSQLPALYRRAAVFVAPFTQAESGDQEGLGLVLVEAIGCGSPVVVGDVPAIRDVLGEQMKSCVVNAADHEALAAAIIEALACKEEARDRAVRLRNKLVKRFDWRQVATEYSELLMKCSRGGQLSQAAPTEE